MTPFNREETIYISPLKILKNHAIITKNLLRDMEAIILKLSSKER